MNPMIKKYESRGKDKASLLPRARLDAGKPLSTFTAPSICLVELFSSLTVYILLNNSIFCFFVISLRYLEVFFP